MEKVEKKDYPLCKLCGSTMHVVRGRFGTFLACDNYKTTGCKGRADDPNREFYVQKKKEKGGN